MHTCVGNLQLFNVWVEPLVHVSVRLVNGDSAVMIEAVNWGIRGSELIQSLNLDRRFSLGFAARLDWTPARGAAGNGAQQNGSGSGSSSAVLVEAAGTGGIRS